MSGKLPHGGWAMVIGEPWTTVPRLAPIECVWQAVSLQDNTRRRFLKEQEAIRGLCALDNVIEGTQSPIETLKSDATLVNLGGSASKSQTI